MERHAMAELGDVDQEFQVHQAAGHQLDVQVACRRLVARDLAAHLDRLSRQILDIARPLQRRLQHPVQPRARLRRSKDRPRPGERQMLPGPRLLALIARETVDADRQQPLRAGRAQPCIDLVQRPRRCMH